MIFGSIFTGAGGMDLGFERAGLKCAWQVEKNLFCRQLLKRHWPDIRRECNVRNLNPLFPLAAVDLLCGGPCPIRSIARNIQGSSSPDLSGYFLALVAGCRPRWVVRENVRAPDVGDFATALELLGYGAAVVTINGAAITGQSRPREFVVGALGRHAHAVADVFHEPAACQFDIKAARGKGEVFSCLLAGRSRRGFGDDCIWDQGRLRICTSDEAERIAGLPPGWTCGFPEETRWRCAATSASPQRLSG